MTFTRISLLGAVLCLVATNVSAVTIDFTSANWNPLGASSITQTVGGITVKVEALEPVGAILHWNGVGLLDGYGFPDGFGVNSSSYEADEIEGPDVLKVTFSTSVIISMIGITDLFNEGNPSYREQGSYSLNAGYPVTFYADPTEYPSPESNGVLTLTGIAPTPVTFVTFAAPGLLNGQNHEFSVSGFQVSPVPEPPTVLLLGSGLAWLGGAAWRRHRRK